MIKYHFLVRWFLRSILPVVVRDVCQDAVDAEVRLVSKYSLTVGAVFGLVSSPVAGETGQAEAVSTRYGHRAGEDVSTQRAQEVLLRQEANRRGHTLKTTTWTKCVLI